MEIHPSVRAAHFLGMLAQEVDRKTRLISIGDVEDGYFIVFARQSRLAGGCTLTTATVARAIAGDGGAHDEILDRFRRCLDRFAA